MGKRKKRRTASGKRRNTLAKIFSIGGTVLLILVIVLCIPITVPRLFGYDTVSYTHLDVYKRQDQRIIAGLIKYVDADAVIDDSIKDKIIAADADKIAAALKGLSNNMFMPFVNGSAVTSAGVYAIRATEEGLSLIHI